MFQDLVGRITCTSELSSENVEVRFMFASIVTRGWIIHAMKVVRIVFCCEVLHLLQSVCLCNGSFNFAFIFTFYLKNLLTSLNWIALMALHRSPIRTSQGRCKIKCCIGFKKPGGKIFSNLQSNIDAILSISAITVRDNSLAESFQNKLLNFASTSHTCSGHSLEPSPEEAAQAKCGSHDSWALLIYIVDKFTPLLRFNAYRSWNINV